MKLPVPKSKSFTVEVEEGTFDVTFRQARNSDELEISALFSERREEYDRDEPGKTIIVAQQNMAVLRATEVRTTLQSCSITNRKGKKLLTAGMDESSFLEAWGQLPPEWADEIYSRCLFMNPQWGASAYEEEEGEEEGEGQEENESGPSSTSS